MSFKKSLTALALGASMFALAACSDPSQAEILKKAENAETKAQLEEILGMPDKVSKMGPVEVWTYNADEGTVSFTLAGSNITLRTAGDGEMEEAPEPRQ